MIYDGLLKGQKVNLRSLTVADCEGPYLKWLNDPEINRYLESRLSEQTPESTRRFVQHMRQSQDNYFFAIVLKEDGRHVGNIKIGPIHPHYKNAFVGYMIGDKSCWGQGLATEAIRLATRFCFDELCLHKVSAGVIAPNAGSIRALEKCGFRLEGTFRDEVLIDGKYEDTLRYGILKGELI